jgi:leucyl-tRNA synthetase
VHINGKRRAELQVARTLSQAQVEEIARQAPGVADKLEGLAIKKVIYVAGKLVNFIV